MVGSRAEVRRRSGGEGRRVYIYIYIYIVHSGFSRTKWGQLQSLLFPKETDRQRTKLREDSRIPCSVLFRSQIKAMLKRAFGHILAIHSDQKPHLYLYKKKRRRSPPVRKFGIFSLCLVDAASFSLAYLERNVRHRFGAEENLSLHEFSDTGIFVISNPFIHFFQNIKTYINSL